MAIGPVQELIERNEISRLRARYWRYWDGKDFEAWLAQFTEDATFTVDMGVAKPGVELPQLLAAGHQEFRDKLIANNFHSVTVHHGHIPEITLHSPTEASGIWPMEDIVERNGIKMHGHGHYHDRYRKIDGAWRFTAVHLTRLRLIIETRG